MVGTSGETRPVPNPVTTRGDWKVSEESLEHKELYKCIHVKEYTKLYDNIYDIHDYMNGNELNPLLIKFFFRFK